MPLSEGIKKERFSMSRPNSIFSGFFSRVTLVWVAKMPEKCLKIGFYTGPYPDQSSRGGGKNRTTFKSVVNLVAYTHNMRRF